MLRASRLFLWPAVMSVKEAVADIKDGASLALGGFGYAGVPFELLDGLAVSRVKDLSLITSSVPGEAFGVGPLVAQRQLKRVVTSYMGENKVFSNAFHKGEVEVELCPMGTLADRMNAGGNGMQAFYVTTGYGTAVSEGSIPRRFAPDGSGTVIDYSPPRETRCINGRWCTLETALKADFALVRAWKADTRGNLLFRGTARSFNIAAAKCGSVCIAEVEELVEAGELDPNGIHMPGVCVHRIVHVPNAARKIESLVTRGGSGARKVNHNDARLRMARRAALEVEEGSVLSLGIGTPTLIQTYIPVGRDVVLMAGNGLLGIGPFPLPGEVDPDIINASKQTVTVDKKVGAVFIDSIEAQGLVRGGYVSMSFMGAMEVSENGDLANWMVPGKRISGMGGGMELVQSGCRVVILTQHVNKDGTPRILHRCRAPLTGRGVVDKIITDLAVFDVVKDGSGVNRLVLTEINEDTALETVQAKTEASFSVSPNLMPMQLAPVPETVA